MAKKLQVKKKDEKETKFGITKIASLLREEGKDFDKKPSNIKEEIKRKKEDVCFEYSGFFQKYEEKVGEKDYDIKETLYVDVDVKEVFSLLKSKGKIQISSLVSFILEEWISDNIEEVREMINREETNRFL